MASTNTIGLYSTKDSQSKSSPSPNLLKKKQSFSFHPSSPSMDFNNNNNKDHCTSHPPPPHRWLNRQLNRFSLRHTKSVQNLKSAMPLTAKNNNDIKLMNDEPLMKEKDQETIGTIYNNNTSNINKETIANGLALFIAEVTFIPSKQNDARLLALKFTKVSGSARIYELATGWITRILRSKND
ncbi:hypothetical protein BJ944DRAFT_272979 [Cunninghamella echinulata]|nr:hypothetical protein BJ944DRAFT_272979 [Cunninghamella echinulata]